MRRKFEIVIDGDVEVVIDLDERVISVVDDEWRKVLYNLQTVDEIVTMVASCLLRGWRLSQLDGWADQPDENAKILKGQWSRCWDCFEWGDGDESVEIREVTTC